MGRRVSWVAPASTSNHTGYPGDLKFPGRCDRFYPNIPIFLQFDDQDMALGLQKNLLTKIWWPGWRYPAQQWPGTGSWRGGKQPGRWSPGGWRSCGGRGLITSTSRFLFQTSLHLVDVRDAWREAKDFMFIAENARSRNFDCWAPVCRFFTFTFCSCSLFIFL